MGQQTSNSNAFNRVQAAEYFNTTGHMKGAAMSTPHHLVAPPVIIAATPVRPLAAPQPAIAPALPPVCTVDLMTLEGSAMFGAQWKAREAKIIEVPAIPDAMPEFKTTYDIDPHAGDAGFDDSAWPIILPTELEAKRGGGKVSFLWFRTRLTIPTRIGAFDPAGAKVVLAVCIDDYAEIWVNGDLPRAAGRPSPATIQGFNMPQRLVLSDAVAPGDTFHIAVFGINGPISVAPANTVWFREARVEFF